MLLKAAELLAAAGELPVNLRFACDGEEEIGGHSIVDWIAQPTSVAPTRRSSSTAAWSRATSPRSTSRVRGLCYFHVTRPDGRARPPLGRVRRRGAERDARADARRSRRSSRARTAASPSRCAQGSRRRRRTSSRAGRSCRRAPSSSPIRARGRSDPGAADEFYLRTWAEPSVDVHGIAGGSPHLVKTVLPVQARGERLDPARARAGSRRDRARPSSGCCERRRPDGAELEVELQNAARAGARAAGRGRRSSWRSTPSSTSSARARCSSAPAARSRSSPALVARGIPTILTGFAIHDSNIHSPNETSPRRVPRRSGSRPPRELFRRLGDAWRLARRSPARSPRSSPTTSSSGSSATSGSTRKAAYRVARRPEHGEAARPLAAARRRASRARARGRRADRARIRLRDAAGRRTARRSSA